MGAEHTENGLYVPRLPEFSTTAGNYEAQRQLDFRLVENEPLQVIPPIRSDIGADGRQPQ